jgi:hypothetical protein
VWLKSHFLVFDQFRSDIHRSQGIPGLDMDNADIKALPFDLSVEDGWQRKTGCV